MVEEITAAPKNASMAMAVLTASQLRGCMRSLLGILSLLLILMTPLAESAWAQGEEVASAIRRYREHEVSTGYYEEYEVKPRRMVPLVEIPGVRRGLFPYSPSAAKVRVSPSPASIIITPP
jgi:hypothetical protein